MHKTPILTHSCSSRCAQVRMVVFKHSASLAICATIRLCTVPLKLDGIKTNHKARVGNAVGIVYTFASVFCLRK